MSESQVDIRTHTSIDAIRAEDWDACACPERAAGGRAFDPFTTHGFLSALETSGSVGEGTGWHPQHLTVQQGEQIIAVMPLYVKTHSQGEYVFDHGWAEAYERAGGQYYPKLQAAVPFTPVAGRRFLTRPEYVQIGQAALVQGMVQIAADNQMSSAHVTFCTKDEAAAGYAMGLLTREGLQYHWQNDDYANFDAFLTALSSRKRKQIRKERRLAQAFGGTIHSLSGAEIQPAHWDAFWHFYQDTGARKWGRPYLTRAFFDQVHEVMADDLLLVLAERNGQPIAGALNVIGRDTLFGRYWGCVEDHPYLHFELCYYQAIDHAIRHGLKRVEAGAQGEHKLARGYLPVTTHSLHWINDPGFREAVDQYLQSERKAVAQDIDVLTSFGPFKTVDVAEHD